jgi:hypothetical protein
MVRALGVDWRLWWQNALRIGQFRLLRRLRRRILPMTPNRIIGRGRRRFRSLWRVRRLLRMAMGCNRILICGRKRFRRRLLHLAIRWNRIVGRGRRRFRLRRRSLLGIPRGLGRQVRRTLPRQFRALQWIHRFPPAGRRLLTTASRVRFRRPDWLRWIVPMRSLPRTRPRRSIMGFRDLWGFSLERRSFRGRALLPCRSAGGATTG